MIGRVFGRLLCKLGRHKVVAKVVYSPSAWSGPCVRKDCGVEVTTPAFLKIKEALSKPDELCPHNCSQRACGLKHNKE